MITYFIERKNNSIKKQINTLFLFFCLLCFSFLPSYVLGYGECSDYGLMSYYDPLTGTCKCMAGYIFGKDFLGQTSCVSGSSVCYDELGYSSRYNSLSNTCECTYGNVIYNGECTSGSSVCRSKHGIYSSYKSYSSICECDSGYTFDDYGKCVKKQNNVYFKLKELDTSSREAIIRSEYDFVHYRVKYGYGCLSSSIDDYVNDNIVVNLGTDFYVDTWDRIVLQNHDQVCDITNVRRVFSTETLYEEEEVGYYPAPGVKPMTPNKSTPSTGGIPQTVSNNTGEVIKSDEITETKEVVTEGPITEYEDNNEKVEPEKEVKIGFFTRIKNWFKKLFS